jgi:hypothetical protein
MNVTATQNRSGVLDRSETQQLSTDVGQGIPLREPSRLIHPLPLALSGNCQNFKAYSSELDGHCKTLSPKKIEHLTSTPMSTSTVHRSNPASRDITLGHATPGRNSSIGISHKSATHALRVSNRYQHKSSSELEAGNNI